MATWGSSGPSWGSSGWGGSVLDVYGSRPAAKKRKKHDDGKGPFGFLGNLVGDLKDAVVGLPMGVVKLVKDPLESFEEIGKATWHTWSPLFQGDIGKFGEQLYDHPLAPIMDVVTVLTGGAGAVGRAGGALAKAGKVSETSWLGRAGAGQRTMTYRQYEWAKVKKPKKRPGTEVEPRVFEGDGWEGGWKPDWDGATEMKALPAGPKPVDATPRGPLERLKGLGTKTPGREIEGKVFHGEYDLGGQKALGAGPAGRRPGDFTKDTISGRRKRVRGKKGKYEWRLTDQPEITRFTSRNPLVRYRQEKIHSLLNKLDPDKPFLGANARYRRKEMADTWHRHAAMQTRIAAMAKGAVLIDKSVKAGEHTAEEGIIARRNLLLHQQNGLKQHAIRWDASKPLPKGYRYVRDRVDWLEDEAAYAAREADEGWTLKDESMAFGHNFTTKDAGKAARQGDKLLIVPTHTAQKLGIEAQRSSVALEYIWRKPTKVWRTMLLGLSPRFLVNNAVGNYWMSMMASNPAKFMRGYTDALRQMYGDQQVARELGKMDKFAAQQFHWHQRFFANQLTNTIGDAWESIPTWERNRLTKKATAGLYPITHGLSDRFLRRALINAHVREIPEVRRMMKEDGLDFNTAAERYLLEDTAAGGLAIQRISERMNDILGDYHSLSSAERKVRDIVPFYAWDRAILRHGGKLLDENPVRANVALDAGTQGTQETEEILGEIPSFLRGVIPLGGERPEGSSFLGLPAVGGKRIPVLGTQGLNPYATLGELAGIAQGATVGGEGEERSIVGTLHPFLQTGLGAITGRDLRTNRELPKQGGILSSAVWNTAIGLPQARLAEAVAGRGFPAEYENLDKYGEVSSTTPSMYTHTWQEVAAAFLGVPVKQLSKKAARKRRKKEIHEGIAIR